ncbi:MAG: hypothetical protein VXZ53_23520, partial [Planctomycetota bacterium]|nr:hypothetical protein [Planctomycetota bacterium]
MHLAVDVNVDDLVSVQPVFVRTILQDEYTGQRHAGPLSVRTVACLSDRVLVSLGGFQQVDQRHASVVLSG